MKLFTVTDKIEALNPNEFQEEILLENLISDYPDLISVDEITRHFVVKRQQPILDSEQGEHQYYLDVLFIDEKGVPVLAEVKRHTDTRIRREVVAQMLDYAMGMKLLDVNDLRKSFRESNTDKPDILKEFDTDDFWEKVKNNLELERMNLAFVADKIPSSLITFINFMNSHLQNICVYGVELKEYQSGSSKVIEKNLIKWDNDSESKPSQRTKGVEWNYEKLINFVSEHHSDMLPTYQKLADYFLENYRCKYGKGYYVASLNIWTVDNNRLFEIDATKENLSISFYSGYFSEYSEMDLSTGEGLEKFFKDETLSKLATPTQIKSISTTRTFLNIPLELLKNDSLYDWFLQKLKDIVKLR